MPKAPLPLRVGLDLAEKSLNALLLRPDGRMHPFCAEFTADEPLDSVFAGLLSELATVLPESREALGSCEAVLASSRSFSALRKDRRVALLITEGFEDTLFLSDACCSPAGVFAGLRFAELCPRERCLGVKERLGADGAVITPLTSDSLSELYSRVAALNVSAVAVVLLHSYQNDAHERTIAEVLAPLGIPVSLSSVVARVPDERLRARATLLDACLAPTFCEELAALRKAGLSRVLCSESAGDVVPASQVLPLRRLLSKAACGLIGAQRLTATHGIPRFLSLGLDSRFATVALCDPTIPPMLQADAAPQTDPDIGIAVPAQELQVVELGNADPSDELQDRLLSALQAITIERGHDPEVYPLVCYGSVKSPLATLLTERLGAQFVLMLPAASFVAAYGALCAPVVCQRRELLFVEASSAQQTGQVAATLHALCTRLRADLQRDGWKIADHLPGAEWMAELRYQGQGMGQLHVLTLTGLGDGGPAVSGATDLVVRFCAEHQRRYGFMLAECPVELVALQMRVTIPTAAPHHTELSKLIPQAARH
jgi:N-methylhydantoinase A/oxoprolinase/acetone carboxylase beta subunit